MSINLSLKNFHNFFDENNSEEHVNLKYRMISPQKKLPLLCIQNIAMVVFAFL